MSATEITSRIAVLSLLIGLSAPLSSPVYGIETVSKPSSSALSCFFKEIKLRILGKTKAEQPASEPSLLSVSRQKLWTYLEREPEIQIKDRLFDVDPRDPTRQSRIAEFFESGKNLGQLNYLVQGDELVIDVTIVTQRYQGKGIGGALLESALRAHPQIRRVSGTYVEDNAQAIGQALARGVSLETAVLSAPTSKSLQRLGFTKVVPGSVRKLGSTFDFALKRP